MLDREQNSATSPEFCTFSIRTGNYIRTDTPKKNQRCATKRPSTAAEGLLSQSSHPASPATPERNRIALQQLRNFLQEAPSKVECERGSVLSASRASPVFASGIDKDAHNRKWLFEPAGLLNGPATRTAFLHFFILLFIKIFNHLDHCYRFVFCNPLQNTAWCF